MRDFFEMQQDAVRRVQEMQKRARQTVNTTIPESEEKEQKSNEVSISEIQNKNPIGRLLNFKAFEGSKEDFLILSLIILLSEENADKMLVLALLYLIM